MLFRIVGRTKNTRSCQIAQLWVDSSQTLSHILSRISLCYRPPCASYTDTGRLCTNSDWQLWDSLSNCLTVPGNKKKKKFAHFSDKIPPKSLIIAALIVFISVSASLLSSLRPPLFWSLHTHARLSPFHSSESSLWHFPPVAPVAKHPQLIHTSQKHVGIFPPVYIVSSYSLRRFRRSFTDGELSFSLPSSGCQTHNPRWLLDAVCEWVIAEIGKIARERFWY